MSIDTRDTLSNKPNATRQRSTSIDPARRTCHARSISVSTTSSNDHIGSKRLLNSTRSTAFSSRKSDKNRIFDSRLPSLPDSFKTTLPQNSNDSRLFTTKHVFWVHHIWQLGVFLELLPSLIDHGRASMFCDQEGNKMDRNGSLSLLQISFATHDITFILDITVLEKAVFETKAVNGLSLRHVLEDPTIVKVYFDVRNDSDAIYSHYGIHLRGVIDLQLMELACRGIRCEATALQSLAKGIELHLGTALETNEYIEWCQAKAAGRKYCDNYGWVAYDERPLPEILARYAAQDTIYMPHLYAVYLWKLQNCPRLMALILRASQKRADDSLLPGYQSGGYGKWLGPVEFLAVDGDDDWFFEEIEAAQLRSQDLVPPNQGWGSTLMWV